MVEYTLEATPKAVVTLTMENYFGCILPTIKINGITIAHFLPDGRLCLRDETTLKVNDIEQLEKAGMVFKHSAIQTVMARDLSR